MPNDDAKQSRLRKGPKLRPELKSYRVRLNGRLHPLSQKPIEGDVTLVIRGVDTQFIELESEEGGKTYFTIIGLDGSNIYTADSTDFRDCVCLESLQEEDTLSLPGILAPRAYGPKLIPLERGKKE